MTIRSRAVQALAPAAILVALFAGLAFASGDDAATKAKNTLSELEAKRNAPPPTPSGDAGAASDAPKRTSAVVAADDAIAEATTALKRAEELRANKDVAHAELAEDLALEWALTARETVAAVEAEREADDHAVQAVEATTKAERARTLLEEAIARRGKLQAKLDELDSELAQKALDAGPPDAKKSKKGGPK